MNDFVVLWIGNNYLIFFFDKILNSLYNSFLIKKKRFFFFLNTYFYFYFFSILNSNIIFKIKTIIDIVATHYPDNLENEFEFLYVNLNYKLNLRFFLKLLIKKEDLIISLTNLYKSVT
jgi:hypothetical protein